MTRPLALLALGLMASASLAGTPRLARVTPPGGQAGTTVEVDFIGRALEAPREILFYEPGIAVESLTMVETVPGPTGKPTPVEPGTRVRARLKIAADCSFGPHGLRLVTAAGITEYHRFFVGPFPTVEETETTTKRNDKRDSATDVPSNSTVLGKLNDPTDIDLYRVEFKKGQRISAEVEAARLGVDRGIPDMFLTIYDPDGRKLAAADDSALYIQDPLLSVVAERDGPHFVEIRHAMFNGAGDVYRLHIGTFSRPTGIYPAGGQVGESLKFTILGDPKGLRNESAKLPANPGDFAYVSVVDGVPAPSPNRLRVSPFPNVLEAEPNDQPEGMAASTVATLPVALNGIIEKSGDVDCFFFRAKKGESFKFHAMASVIGSPADPAIWIRAVNGKSKAPIARSTESRPNQLGYAPAGGLNRDTNDPILEFTAPADGDYVLGVEEERGQGGPDYVYRVEVLPDDNAVYTYIAAEPENQQAPQARQNITVAAGNRYTAQIAIFSTNRQYVGDLELVGVNLPKGVTLKAPKFTPGQQKVPVVFEAAPGTPPQAALVDLVVRPVGGDGKAPTSGYHQTIMMNAYGNNDYYMHVPVEKLALAVTEPAPFSVHVEEPKSALVQNGEMALKFTVRRETGFDGPVTVQMEYKPTGISTATPVTVPAGQSEGVYLLGAARNAAAGVHQVALTAMSGTARRGYSDGESRTLAASKPFALTVAEPHIEAKIPRASIERGKTATLVCKLNQLQPFEGKAKATLARLPRGVELVEAEREITSQDKDVTFTIRATPEALVGNYQGIVLDLTVTEKGQAVRQLSGSGILRIDAERGVPAPQK
jgi:hypothetical protein